MSVAFAIALYFVIWWTLLFAVLPIGVRSQLEDGNVAPGTEAAAPVRPMMLKKALITSLVAAIALAVVYAVLEWKLVSLDAIPFLPKFTS